MVGQGKASKERETTKEEKENADVVDAEAEERVTDCAPWWWIKEERWQTELPAVGWWSKEERGVSRSDHHW